MNVSWQEYLDIFDQNPAQIHGGITGFPKATPRQIPATILGEIAETTWTKSLKEPREQFLEDFSERT